MPPSFDVRLDDLTGARAESRRSAQDSDLATWRVALPASEQALPSSGQGSGGGTVLLGEGDTFYIETFGCQMNAHDSEKVAGVLLGRGYRQVEEVDAAKLVFYNTCSIRENAGQQVFSRLGA